MTSYALGVAVFILRGNSVLLVHQVQAGKHSLWDVPLGRSQSHESATETAARALFDEVGLGLVEARSFGNYVSDADDCKIEFLFVIADGELSRTPTQDKPQAEWFDVHQLPHPTGPILKAGLQRLGL